MRQSRSSGSVEGVVSNDHSYSNSKGLVDLGIIFLYEFFENWRDYWS